MTSNPLLVPRPYKLYHIIKSIHFKSRIDEARIQRVLRFYDQGPLTKYRKPAIGFSRCTNIFLRLGGERKLLKQYKASLSPEAIAYEHSVLQHLADHNFPSPRLNLSREGTTYVEVDGQYFTIFDYIPGFRYVDYFIPAKQQHACLIQAGQALARYHHAMEGFTPAGKKFDAFKPDGKSRWRDQKWYHEQFTKYRALFEAKGEKSPLDQFFLDNLDRLTQRYIYLNEKVEENTAELPKVVIHGDYGPHNLLYDRAKLTGVLDFECTHLNLRAAEMMVAFKFFAGRNVGLDYAKVRAFFRAYNPINAIAHEEIVMMPDIFELYHLERLINYFRDYFNSNNNLRLQYAHNVATRIDWMERNSAALIKSLLTSN